MAESIRRRFKLTSIHYAWIFMYANTLLFFTRSGQDVAAVDAGSTYRILMATLAGVIMALNVLRHGRTMGTLFTSVIGLFFFYGFIGLISSTYSSQPFYSMWKSIEILIISALPAVLISERREDAVVLLFRLTAVLFILTLLNAYAGLLYAPGDAMRKVKGVFQYSLQGVKPWLNPNTIGSIAAISAYYALTRSFNVAKRAKRWSLYLLAGLGFGAVLFSTSRTAVAASIVGIGVFTLFDRRYKLLTLLVALGVAILSVDLMRETTVAYLEKEQSEKALTTLSGRTIGWAAAWDYFKQAPLFGHGLAAAGRFDVLGGAYTSLHGAFFDVLVGVGGVGAAFWLLAIVVTGIKLLRPAGLATFTREERFGRAVLLGLLALVLVRTFTNSSLAFHDRETLLFLSILAAASLGRRVFAKLAST